MYVDHFWCSPDPPPPPPNNALCLLQNQCTFYIAPMKTDSLQGHASCRACVPAPPFSVCTRGSAPDEALSAARISSTAATTRTNLFSPSHQRKPPPRFTHSLPRVNQRFLVQFGTLCDWGAPACVCVCVRAQAPPSTSGV